MKVAIWGSLNFGNFGDEIMNIMIGLKLKSLGCDVYLYRLDAKQAERYGLKTVDSLDSLLEGAKFSIIGGGSWLESRPLGLDYESDFEDYLENIEKYAVPFYVISIGGDTNNDYRRLTIDRYRLFSCKFFQGGTVRLKSDLKTMEIFQKDIECYPDIVLLSDSFFLKKQKEKSDKFRIAISVTNHSKSDFFNKIVGQIPFFYDNYEIYYLRTHLPNYSFTYEHHSKFTNTRIHNVNYENLEDFFSILNNMDIVISQKLHPGVAALSCNTPFLWVGGSDKVAAFFNSIGFVRFKHSIGSLMKMIMKKQIQQYVINYNFDEIHSQKTLAIGHLNYLERLVTNYKI